MGSVFGKIDVETPKFELLQSTPDYEIRRYSSSVVAQVTYDPSSQTMGSNKDGGFTILANYIGVLGKPQNAKPEKIAMTAPVITATTPTPTPTPTESEKIAMTAPVNLITEKNMVVTMQFVLPSKYTKAEEAPRPIDERVIIKEVEETKYGVVKFSGVATDALVEDKVQKLKTSLERDGYKVIGDFLLARYNPPWTLPPFRTNEIMIPVQ